MRVESKNKNSVRTFCRKQGRMKKMNRLIQINDNKPIRKHFKSERSTNKKKKN